MGSDRIVDVWAGTGVGLIVKVQESESFGLGINRMDDTRTCTGVRLVVGPLRWESFRRGTSGV